MTNFHEQSYNDRNDDYENQNTVSTDNDDIGENTEATPIANAINNESAEDQFLNDRSDDITGNDQRVPTVTPDDENAMPGLGKGGQDNLIDDNRINGAMSPQEAGVFDNYDTQAPDPDNDDDEELIPIETEDDDDDDLGLDDDDDLEDEDQEDDELDTDDKPTTFTTNTDFSSRDHGRVTGTMIDHEPGLPGSGGRVI